MVTKEQIGAFEFVAQTTYYMYVAGQEKPVLTTSDTKLFERQKQLAIEGKIEARNFKTDNLEL